MIQKHLKKCPDCRTYLRALKKTIQLYRHYPQIKISRSEEKELLHCIFPSEKYSARKQRK
jgi:predicted anti-sigma-YlaC factor YlaD